MSRTQLLQNLPQIYLAILLHVPTGQFFFKVPQILIRGTFRYIDCPGSTLRHGQKGPMTE